MTRRSRCSPRGTGRHGALAGRVNPQTRTRCIVPPCAARCRGFFLRCCWRPSVSAPGTSLPTARRSKRWHVPPRARGKERSAPPAKTATTPRRPSSRISRSARRTDGASTYAACAPTSSSATTPAPSSRHSRPRAESEPSFYRPAERGRSVPPIELGGRGRDLRAGVRGARSERHHAIRLTFGANVVVRDVLDIRLVRARPVVINSPASRC
jgi:hypothetical protein